jgi:hypothetical protein
MDTVVVLTGKNLERIFLEGGSGDWRANINTIANCKYIVAVANSKSPHFDKHSIEMHQHAFLVGKVTGTFKLNDRIVIEFDEYAIVDIPNAWNGQRNPVRYTDISELGIYPDQLDWKAFPKDNVKKNNDVKPLTIEDAKNGIAKMLGISPDCIEITIRA